MPEKAKHPHGWLFFRAYSGEWLNLREATDEDIQAVKAVEELNQIASSVKTAEQLEWESQLDLMKRITIEEAKMRLRSASEPPWSEIDPGILPIVKILFEEGIETYESCQGGKGHPYPEPTVRFHGSIAEGWRALYVALAYDLHPTNLKRIYSIQDKEPVGPTWEITFHLSDYPGWDGKAGDSQ